MKASPLVTDEMIEQKDLMLLIKRMNIGGDHFGNGWASSIETSGIESDDSGLY